MDASLVTKAMPMPESRKVMGKSAGSALGAKRRTARWAIANATKSPMGTESELSVTESCMSMTYMDQSRMTGSAASTRRPSSELRLVLS